MIQMTRPSSVFLVAVEWRLVAEKTGLAPDSIGLIERGRRWARLSTLHRIAKALKIGTDELFKGLKQ